MEWWAISLVVVATLFVVGLADHLLRFRGDPYRHPWLMRVADIPFYTTGQPADPFGLGCDLAVRWHNLVASFENDIIDEWRWHSCFTRDRVPSLRVEVHVFASFLAIWFLREAGITGEVPGTSPSKLLEQMRPIMDESKRDLCFVTALQRVTNLHVSRFTAIDGPHWRYHGRDDDNFLSDNYKSVAHEIGLRISEYYQAEHTAMDLAEPMLNQTREDRDRLLWETTVRLAYAEHIHQVQAALGVRERTSQSKSDLRILQNLSKQLGVWLDLLRSLARSAPQDKLRESRHDRILDSVAAALAE